MRSSTPPSQNPPAPVPTYSPSVPLSVYRELSAELQAAEVLLDSLNVQNQQLTRQNQQLRQEIDKAVQSVLHLQQVVDSYASASWSESPHSTSLGTQSSRVASSSPQRHRTQTPSGYPSAMDVPYSYQLKESSGAGPEAVFTEQEENRYLRRPQVERAGEINGWWLAVAIFLIVATAFGTGYLIVRPLLQHR